MTELSKSWLRTSLPYCRGRWRVSGWVRTRPVICCVRYTGSVILQVGPVGYVSINFSVLDLHGRPLIAAGDQLVLCHCHTLAVCRHRRHSYFGLAVNDAGLICSPCALAFWIVGVASYPRDLGSAPEAARMARIACVANWSQVKLPVW